MTYSINRRDVIAKAGAVAGASLVALPAVALTREADAELRALFSELEALTAKGHEASERASRLIDEVESTLPPEPPHPFHWKTPDMPADIDAIYKEAIRNVRFGDVAKFDWYPEPVRKWYADVEEQKARGKAAWEEHGAAWASKYEAIGGDAAEAEFDRYYNACSEIGRRLFALPAETIAGIALKVRAGELLDFEEPDEDVYASIVADIKRLSGVAS